MALGAASGEAGAWSFNTFTMIGRCQRTGALGVAMASSPVAVASRCPVVKANVAAISSQANAHPGLGPLAMNLIELGYSPEKAISEVSASDRWIEYRQVGIVDRNGDSAAYVGSEIADWKGARSGRNYVAMGNNLRGAEILDAMEDAWRSGEREELLEDRLLLAIEAGKAAGGEKGGHLSAGLIVHTHNVYARTDLRVDMHVGEPGTDSVDGIRSLFEAYRPLVHYYQDRVQDPLLEPWRDWLKGRDVPFHPHRDNR